MSLQSLVINGKKIVAQDFVLKALYQAHQDLVKLGIGYKGKLGFILSNDVTGSWRSESLQRSLLETGASKTMYSNHRRGTAVDCAADWAYIKLIRPTMNKYNLFNDLAYTDGRSADDDPFPGASGWDGGHWNWGSNVIATHAADIINILPSNLQEFSMNGQYDGQIIWNEQGHGEFAGVYRGEKHIITKENAGLAGIHPLLGGKKAVSVTLAIWNSIPTGLDFAAVEKKT